MYFALNKFENSGVIQPNTLKAQDLHIVLMASLFCFAAGTAAAQEGGMPLEYESIDYDRDKMLYSPGGEGEYRSSSKSTPSSNPSTKEVPAAETVKRTEVKALTPSTARPKFEPAAKPGEKPVTPTSTAKETPEDNLGSFNFLYYVIQKYKLQDIVD